MRAKSSKINGWTKIVEERGRREWKEKGNDGDSFQLMRENKREREREKKGGSSRPRALLIKLSTRLSTPIRLPCFEPCRRVIPTNFGYGHCINRCWTHKHGQTFHLDADGYRFVRFPTLSLVSNVSSFFEAECLPFDSFMDHKRVACLVDAFDWRLSSERWLICFWQIDENRRFFHFVGRKSKK